MNPGPMSSRNGRNPTKGPRARRSFLPGTKPTHHTQRTPHKTPGALRHARARGPRRGADQRRRRDGDHGHARRGRRGGGGGLVLAPIRTGAQAPTRRPRGRGRGVPRGAAAAGPGVEGSFWGLCLTYVTRAARDEARSRLEQKRSRRGLPEDMDWREVKDLCHGRRPQPARRAGPRRRLLRRRLPRRALRHEGARRWRRRRILDARHRAKSSARVEERPRSMRPRRGGSMPRTHSRRPRPPCGASTRTRTRRSRRRSSSEGQSRGAVVYLEISIYERRRVTGAPSGEVMCHRGGR